MPDNVTANPGAGGAVLATDDIGGVQYPRVKITFGDDGAATDASATSPLPVTLSSTQISALAPLATQPVSAGALGAVADAEVATGDGSMIAILKRLRTLISGTLATSSTAIGDIADAEVATGNGSVIALLKRLRTLSPALGAAAPSASLPVTLSNDVSVGAAASLAAINVDLLTGVASGWFDASNFQSVKIQIVGAAGITAGAIFFEETNDIAAAAAGNVWAVEETTLLTPTPIIAATAITASTIRMFGGPVTARYVRVRVSTAFTGGNVQAIAVFSQMPYVKMVNTIHQATAGNLNTNVSGSLTSVTTVSSVTSGNIGSPSIVADIASAALTTTTTTAAITPSFGTSYEINIPVTAVAGTTPTLDVVVQESDDNGTNWFDVYHFPRITASGIYRSPKLALQGNRIRYVQTLGGTTPSFTRSLNRLQCSDTVEHIRQVIDRSLNAAQALNAVTATVIGPNCRNWQLIINSAAITTAPAFQLEGSNDFGLTWYAIGTPLTAVANSTVQLTVASFNAALVRARVSTAGVTATLNYVTLKGF